MISTNIHERHPLQRALWGPLLSWVGQVDGKKYIAEFRWMHEYGVEKRLSGDTLFLTP